VTAFVEFCGEVFPVDETAGLVIGREGDVAIDDNAYLHRHFLRVYESQGMWWLANVGSQLTATVSGADGALQAFLAPGAQLPVVLPDMTIRFSAGNTTYELGLRVDKAVYDAPQILRGEGGATTASVPTLNHDQRLLLLALAEPALKAGHRAVSSVPSSQSAADRLG
jgi:hypothetical protein